MPWETDGPCAMLTRIDIVIAFRHICLAKMPPLSPRHAHQRTPICNLYKLPDSSGIVLGRMAAILPCVLFLLTIAIRGATGRSVKQYYNSPPADPSGFPAYQCSDFAYGMVYYYGYPGYCYNDPVCQQMSWTYLDNYCSMPGCQQSCKEFLLSISIQCRWEMSDFQDQYGPSLAANTGMPNPGNPFKDYMLKCNVPFSLDGSGVTTNTPATNFPTQPDPITTTPTMAPNNPTPITVPTPNVPTQGK